jgi:hypothetical protein
MKVILISLIFLSYQAHADGFDMGIHGDYRNQPLSGVAELGTGYSLALWGDEKSPWLGYVRAGWDLDGITNYFSSTLTAEFFPISILGVRIGKSWIQNSADFDDYECINYLCRGKFTQSFIEVPLYLGWDPILFSASYRVETWTSIDDSSQNSKLGYIDPTSGTDLSPQGSDKLHRVRAAMFYKLSDNFRLGYVNTQYAENGRTWLFGGQFLMNPCFSDKDEFSVFLGAGEFRSRLILTEPTVYVGLSYSPIKKLGY